MVTSGHDGIHGWRRTSRPPWPAWRGRATGDSFFCCERCVKGPAHPRPLLRAAWRGADAVPLPAGGASDAPSLLWRAERQRARPFHWTVGLNPRKVRVLFEKCRCLLHISRSSARIDGREVRVTWPRSLMSILATDRIEEKRLAIAKTASLSCSFSSRRKCCQKLMRFRF
jgi:hypothetical protein